MSVKVQSAFTDEEREEFIQGAMNHSGFTRAHAETMFDSIGDRRATRNPLLARQWVRNLVTVADDLQTGRAKPEGLFVSVFWIRLYGVLTDLRSSYREMAELDREFRAAGRPHPWIAACAELFDACCAIRDALSDDELVYAAFIRHVHAHVYQNGFEYEIERGNPEMNQQATLRAKQMVATVRRHVGIDEAHEIVDRVSEKYGHDDVRVAVNFAHKLRPHVERLGLAMEAFEVEREKDVANTLARIAARAAGPEVPAAGEPTGSGPKET